MSATQQVLGIAITITLSIAVFTGLGLLQKKHRKTATGIIIGIFVIAVVTASALVATLILRGMP